MRGSTLALCGGVPLDPRYEHSILWEDIPRQINYFNGKAKHWFTDFSYLRKEGTVKVPLYVEDLEDDDISYCFITNGESGRYRFYFITNKEYVSDGVTRLHLELDVLQTYQHDWTIPACFVEREHPSSDQPGSNLVDENLELGSMYVNSGELVEELKTLAIVVQSSVSMQNPMGEDVKGYHLAGIYSGHQLYARTCNELGATVLNAALSSLDTSGKTDGVQAIWVYPRALINADWANEADEVMLNVKGAGTFDKSYTQPATLNGYTPRNRKLLTYPYQYMYVHNNNGGAATYRYELFEADPHFRFGGATSIDGVVRMAPVGYRGYLVDNESGLSLSGYPSCSWSQDYYKIWMAQNAAQQDLTMIDGGVKVAVGAVQTAAGVGQAIAGGGLGGVASGVGTMYSGGMQIAGLLAQRHDMQVQPPQSKGVHSGSVNIGLGMQNFTVCHMSISYQYAEIIDSYFDMYGYAVKRVKTPNYTARPLWNYIKTVGCVVQGDFDANDRRIVAAIFDKGVTWWRAPETIYRYDLAGLNTAWSDA